MPSRIPRTRQRELYGVTGRKGHGKDTFATEVIKANEQIAARRHGRTFARTYFAEALKTMCGRIFGLTKAQMYDPSLKEARFPEPLEMDRFLQVMRLETSLFDLQPAGKVAHSAREVLQYFGTDYVRKTRDDYWVQRTMNYARGWRRLLIPDTRFPNEAAAIREQGGKVVKIVRLDMVDSGDPHASEKSIDLIEPDLLLAVKTGDLSIMTRVAMLIAQGKFDAARKYDWRNAEKAMNAYASGLGAGRSARLLGTNPSTLYSLLKYYERPNQDVTDDRESLYRGCDCD